MSEVLKTVPAASPAQSGVEGPKPVAEALSGVLADTYALLLKTHSYHWNVEGPLFHSIHVLTEDQYNVLFAATDELAERIRALGLLAPMGAAAILQDRLKTKGKARPSAQEMLTDLAGDHEAAARALHDLITLAEDHNDPVTADLATQKSAFHEKAAWMLRAMAA